jgi:hypothetical protein
VKVLVLLSEALNLKPADVMIRAEAMIASPKRRSKAA